MEGKENVMGRRTFLEMMSIGTLCLAGGFAALVGAGFLYPVPKRKTRPLFICLESEVREGKPLEIKDTMGRKALIIRKGGGKLLVVGTVCSHLGCSVFYRPEENFFECPCHQGFFDGEGNPVSGPPQRPLERYPVEVRDGKVFVQFA